MKKHTITCVTIAGLCCLWPELAVQARNIAYNTNLRPRMSLSTALALADKALGKDSKVFYCVGAELAVTRSLNGDWLLRFASTNGGTRFVDVGFDHRVHIHKPSDGAVTEF